LRLRRMHSHSHSHSVGMDGIDRMHWMLLHYSYAYAMDAHVRMIVQVGRVTLALLPS